MRPLHAALLLFPALLCTNADAVAQSASPAAPASATTAAGATSAGTTAELMQPAITTVLQTLNIVRVDKWKAPNGVRDEMEANIKSIRSDLDGTLPTLMTDADAAPASTSKLLALFRNVDALYDVLLRVSETGALSAPRPQTDALQQAMGTLDDARRSLGDRLQRSTIAQEQSLIEAQAALRARPPAPAPAAAEPVAHAPAATARPTPKARKPKPKPTPSTPATPAPAPAK